MDVELYHPVLKQTITVDARSARVHRKAGWRDASRQRVTTGNPPERPVKAEKREED